MSKEVIRSNQFAHVDAASLVHVDHLELNQEQLQEMSDLYEGIFSTLKPGKLVTGKVVELILMEY